MATATKHPACTCHQAAASEHQAAAHHHLEAAHHHEQGEHDEAKVHATSAQCIARKLNVKQRPAHQHSQK